MSTQLLAPATGEVPDHAPAPDPYESVRSTVRTGRGSKGQTTRRVIRHGSDYPVVGSWQATGRRTSDENVPSDVRMAAAWHAARVMARDGGWTSRDLVRIADAFIGDDVPRLLGGDLVSWEEVIRHGDGAVDAYSVACHHSGLTGGGIVGAETERDATALSELEELARPITARRVNVRRRAPRLRITARRRKGESDRRTFVAGPSDVTVWREHWSPVDDVRAFIGHQSIARPVVTRRARRKDARTIGTADVTSRLEVERAVLALNRGERVTIVAGSTRGTITRGTSGRYAWRITRGPKGASILKPATVVDKLAAALNI